MALAWLYGQARTTFCHAETTIRLPIRAKNDIETYASLSHICETVTPQCRLNPLLFNGHLQTAWTAMKSADIPVYYRRHVFDSKDPPYPGTFAVDFVAPKPAVPLPVDESLPPRTTHYSDEEFQQLGSNDSRPMLILLHGLSGGSHEIYLRHVIRDLVPKGWDGDQDWDACVVNSRGCAESKITTHILYNARATWDVRQTVEWIREKWPNRRLFGIGFSLGANILTNYLGEEGSNCKLDAAVIVSNPWNLEVSSLAMQSTFLGRRMYSQTMGNNMRALFEKHVDQVSKNPNIDVEKVRSCTYLHEFDRQVQCPSWGYPTEGAYYRDASSVESVLSIRIPTYCINAEDDPISADQAIPREEIKKNPYVVLCTTSVGGHLSWFEVGGGRWFSKASVAFLNSMAKEVDGAKWRADAGADANGHLPPGNGKTAIYEPLRRKLWIPPVAQK